MGRYWSLLFLLVPIFGVGTFVVGMTGASWLGMPVIWLPTDISEHGHEIDHLWNFILVLTGLVFVATEVVLFWFLWKYGDENRRDDPVKYTHGSHNLEVVWTILPAATLLFIAIYQMNAWANVKMRKPAMAPTVEVVGRQFEWRLRYPGPDGKLNGEIDTSDPEKKRVNVSTDDIYVVNEMHVPVDEDILVYLKSMDVLHDFFLPNLRVKQDAVPGMMIPVWFRAKQMGEYDLVCAELCGWGHYKMKGRLIVESRPQYEAWLEQQRKLQETQK